MLFSDFHCKENDCTIWSPGRTCTLGLVTNDNRVHEVGVTVCGSLVLSPEYLNAYRAIQVQKSPI